MVSLPCDEFDCWDISMYFRAEIVIRGCLPDPGFPRRALVRYGRARTKNSLSTRHGAEKTGSGSSGHKLSNKTLSTPQITRDYCRE